MCCLITYGDSQWWVWILAACGLEAQDSWLVSRAGDRFAVLRSLTGWTVAVAVTWWQHDKHSPYRYLRRKKAVMFLGLSVCLSAGLLKKSYEQILMKFFEGLVRGSGSKWLDFGGCPNQKSVLFARRRHLLRRMFMLSEDLLDLLLLLCMC